MDPIDFIESRCAAARNILVDFGPDKALGYLIGEKFLSFLGTADRDDEWRQAIPTFVAEIKAIFEGWQIASYLNEPRRLGALGHVADDQTHQLFRQQATDAENLQEDARNLVLVEWARQLLLNDGGAG
jgi:hypothetical protein